MNVPRIDMKKEYSYLWAFVLAQVLFLEVTSYQMDLPWWLWAVVLGQLILIEAVAVARPKSGDTFSELNWVFLRGGWARAFLVAAVAVYLSIRFYMIGGLPGVEEWVPRAILAGGLGSWLLFHFLSFGDAG